MMEPLTVFSAANNLAMAGWLAMLVAPRTRLVTWWICGLGIPGLLAALYALLMLIYAPHAEGGFSSLAEVALLFRHDGVLLAENINPWAVRLCLPPTFLVGPVGLLLFLILRFFLLRRVSPGHPS